MSRADDLPKILSQAAQQALLAELNPRYQSPHRNLCMLRLMLEAGLRVGEVVALRPEHLDMTTCKLTVRDGKGSKDRTLWINDYLRDEIGAWLQRRPESVYSSPPGTEIGSRRGTCPHPSASHAGATR